MNFILPRKIKLSQSLSYETPFGFCFPLYGDKSPLKFFSTLLMCIDTIFHTICVHSPVSQDLFSIPLRFDTTVSCTSLGWSLIVECDSESQGCRNFTPTGI